MSSAAIDVRHVSFAYPAALRRGGRARTLADLTFTIERGEILGVVGPNSAGKTTLVRVLTKVVAPDCGEVLVEGEPLARLAPTDVARRIAVVPQQVPESLHLTVGELALMGRYPHHPGRFFEGPEDLAIAREAMAATDVIDLATAPLASLSGGERQRAVLARALAQEPRLLVLDEPTAHLDLRYQAECVGLLRRLNRERQMTILCVSHDVNLAAELCDRLLLLADGRLVRIGAPAEVLDERALSEVYGCALTVEKSPSGRPHVTVWWPDGERG
jgi:iron complex transport system ATP-binding protein